jgi:PhnB protein
MYVEPYLFLDGRCEEALDFYKKALRAEVTALIRFKESPDPTMVHAGQDPNKILHAVFKIGDTMIMTSDGRNTGNPTFQGFALSISVANEAEAEKTFKALSDGGRVEMPLTKTFFSPRFGMVFDRFGVCWMVIVMQQPPRP